MDVGAICSWKEGNYSMVRWQELKCTLDLTGIAAQRTCIRQTAMQQSWQLRPRVMTSQHDSGSCSFTAAPCKLECLVSGWVAGNSRAGNLDGQGLQMQCWHCLKCWLQQKKKRQAPLYLPAPDDHYALRVACYLVGFGHPAKTHHVYVQEAKTQCEAQGL